MIKRPTSVTIIAWILIVVYGGFLVGGRISSCMGNRYGGNTDPYFRAGVEAAAKEEAARDVEGGLPRKIWKIWYQIIDILVPFVCGVFFLRGANWSRWLYVIYVIWGVADSLIHIFNFSASGSLANHLFSGQLFGLILCLVFYSLMVFLLFRTPSNAYFTRKLG